MGILKLSHKKPCDFYLGLFEHSFLESSLREANCHVRSPSILPPLFLCSLGHPRPGAALGSKEAIVESPAPADAMWRRIKAPDIESQLSIYSHLQSFQFLNRYHGAEIRHPYYAQPESLDPQNHQHNHYCFTSLSFGMSCQLKDHQNI